MRRNIYAKDIILEAIQRVDPVRITKRELIRMVGLRRTVFLKALKNLIDGSKIARSGTGRKRDSFKYGVAYFNGSTDDVESASTGSYPRRTKLIFSY